MNQYIGKRLGSYQLLEQIGQGGMATIFKAYQPSMDRYVAVKILPSHFTEDETFVARFTQEARTLARLEHPHILPVHDYGEQEGITYLVMRYIEAGTLKDVIAQRGPLHLKEAARILDQVGRALGYAHNQGVVHRDIKPTNVLIDERGDAFLTDFGIAKLVAGTSQFTATGAIVGTPAYMSPEQGLGEPADHRSDIYSLGVVLYEMATGRVPFEAETPLAVLLKHVNDPLPPPRQVKPDLAEAVERVILKAMAKLPDDRFQTVEEMVEALQKTVTGVPAEIALPRPLAEPTDIAEPARAVRVPLPEPTVAAPSRRSLPWLPIAGGVAALAMALIAALLILPRLGGGKTQATPTLERLFAQATAEPAAATDVAPLSPGWTNYSNGNFVRALARQNNYLWAGGEGGLARWDLEDGSYLKFGVADGLASNWVNALLVDEDNVLWVATDAGVNRFDGETWLTFDETDGLDSDEVGVLFSDDDGALWAGTAYGQHGLNYYAGTSWGPPPIPPLPLEFPRPRAFALDAEGGLFVGLDEQGLAYFDGDAWHTFTSDDGMPGDQVYDLLLIDGEVLLASFGHEVVQFDLETGDWEIIPQLSEIGVYRMHEAEDGSLWFAGEGGATRYDPGTGDWQRFESGPATIPAWEVTDIVEDEDGLWLGTYGGGVAFYDGTSWEIWVTDDQLGGNEVDAILQDGGGALWFTHPGSGLSRYDPTDDDWQTFGEDEGALDWPSGGVDTDGRIWIGGYGEIKRYDGRTWQSFTPAQLADVTIYLIAFGPNDVQWLWTDAGLMRHDLATDEWTTFTAADHSVLEQVNTLFIADDGTLWVGGASALVGYDGSSWSIPTASGDPPEYVSDIAEAPDGSLWVAADGVLYHLDGERWIHSSWPGDGWIESVAAGPDGIIWAGHDGLGRFDPSSGAWQIFTPADGLVDHWVKAIYTTPEGIVWVGTGGGVSRYVPGE